MADDQPSVVRQEGRGVKVDEYRQVYRLIRKHLTQARWTSVVTRITVRILSEQGGDVREVAQKQVDLWQRWLEKHWEMAERYARKRWPTLKEHAEDIAQEVMKGATNYIYKNCDYPTDVYFWIIVRNQCLQYYDKEKKQPQPQHQELSEENIPDHRCAGEPERRELEQKFNERKEDEVAKRSGLRALIWACLASGMDDPKAIAEKAKCAVKRVKEERSHYRRCMRQVARELGIPVPF